MLQYYHTHTRMYFRSFSVDSDETLFLLATCYYRAGKKMQAYSALRSRKLNSSKCKFLMAKCCVDLEKWVYFKFHHHCGIDLILYVRNLFLKSHQIHHSYSKYEQIPLMKVMYECWLEEYHFIWGEIWSLESCIISLYHVQFNSMTLWTLSCWPGNFNDFNNIDFFDWFESRLF